MASNNLLKSFFNDKGLDLRSSDLTRQSQYASDILNEDFRKTGAINKRKGFQAKAETVGGNGLGIYANINDITGEITQELLTLDSNLHKVSEQTFTVTYTGAAVARISMKLDPLLGKFVFILTVNDVDILTYNLETGINEASVITLANLKVVIDAVTDFSAVISGSDAVPASFLDISRDLPVNSSGTAIPYIQYDVVNSPLSTPLAVYNSNRNTSEFENACFVNLSNVLYVSTGHDFLYKYDSQSFYRAGMPQAIIPTAVSSGAGNITNSANKYIITHIQIDKKNNVIEGIESDPSNTLALTNENVDLTVTNILNTTGFNTNCAIIDGLQSGVNIITVDDGAAGPHTMKVGDTAYFYDGVSADYVEREVTAITANSITISGAAVDVADNAVMSANLRIAIYRNQDAGNSFFLVTEIPNNSFNSTQVYSDTLVASSLGATYVPPIKPHGLPPKGKYITSFRNLLIVSGNIEDVNNVYYSDIDGPEYFPPASNAFLVETERGDKVSGIAKNNNALFIFKDQSIHALTGDIAQDSFRVDEVTGGDVGCSSHHSIVELKGRLIFLGQKGVFAIALGDNEPEEISAIIDPIFNTYTASQYNYKKAVAINWIEQNKYVLFLPVEIDSSGLLHTNLNQSKLVVFDYSRKAWLIWNNIDPQGGMISYKNKLHFSERRLGTVSGIVESYTYKIQDTGDTFDYADHTQAINFYHKTNWENMGDPDVFKKYLRLKVHSPDASINDFETDTFVIGVETQINFNDSVSSYFDLDFGEFTIGWGEFPWNDTYWGSVRAIELKSKLKVTKSRAMRIIYTNNGIHENILLAGWTIEANLPFRTAIKE